LFDFLVEIRGFVNYFGGGKGIELVMKIVKEKEKKWNCWEHPFLMGPLLCNN
jgi:hypothetical protein